MVLDVPFQLFIDLKEVGPLGNLDFGGTMTLATAFQKGFDAIHFGGSPQLKGGVDFRGVGGSPVDIGDLSHLDNPIAEAIPLGGAHLSRGRFGDAIGVNGATSGDWRWAGKIGVTGRVSLV